MFLTLDFETYYDDVYSLSKMTTDAYVMDDRFFVHGVGIKIDDGPTRWFRDAQVEAALKLIPWEDTILCAHNTCFDGFILTQRYGHKPRFYVDTLSMARYLIGASVGGSLAATAQHFNLGVKGRELLNTKGIRLLTAAQSKELGQYCVNDTDLCHAAYRVMKPHFPLKEMQHIDMLMRMFCEPMFMLHEERLAAYYDEVVQKKEELLRRCGFNDREHLMSDVKFAAVLEGMGVDPPTKVSPKTGLTTFAFAKTDAGMKDLLSHEDDEVRWLAEARVGVKTTIEETRAARFLAIARENRPFPIMLNYYGAHTGRYSGGNKMNPQNLKRGGVLRRCLLAPPGHVVLSCDSSQIEARLTAYVAGQDDLVEDFGNKADIYSKFAAEEVYHEPVTKKDTEKRFVGKTCLTGDTLVLTARGIKPVVAVSQDDLLWDGNQWVPHGGLICQGVKEVQYRHGIGATLDHEILVDGGWANWSEVLTDPSLFQMALSSASSPYSGGFGTYPRPANHGVTNRCAAVLAGGRAWLLDRVLSLGAQHAATPAPRSQQVRSATGSIEAPCLMTRTEPDYSTDWLPQYLDATSSATKRTPTMVGEGYWCTFRGGATEENFSDTFKASPVGMIRRAIWTGLTTIVGMSRGIFGLRPGQRTPLTSERSWSCKPESPSLRQRLPVFDLVNAGPQHRFTVMSRHGPVIVHNCILGLGFGMGPPKFKATLALGTNGPVVHVEDGEAIRVVQAYRRRFHRIPHLWDRMENALMCMASGRVLDDGFIQVKDGKLWLPNGMAIQYHDLHREDGGWVFLHRKKPTKTYGGKATENLIQGLAKIVVADQMLEIQKHAPVKLMVHDEPVMIVPEKDAEEVAKIVEQIMSTPPEWAPGLPVACESGWGKSFGEC